MNYIMYIITIVLLLLSLVFSRKKTLKALKIAFKRFIKILPAFLAMIILVSIVLFFVSNEMIAKYLGGDNTFLAVIAAAIAGSVILMPGFIAFPLSGILIEHGVLYMVISAFTTTLMMVGLLTLPVEKEYFGIKTALYRNSLCFLTAIIVAVATGFYFGEIL